MAPRAGENSERDSTRKNVLDAGHDKNEKIGTLDDIIIDHSKVMAGVLQVGGFLGIGSRRVAVPYEDLQIDDTGRKIVLPEATREELQKLAEFKYES